jgi:predicted GTPase
MARGTKLVLLGFGLVVPLLTLLPLGGAWLWQNGYVLHWAAGACAFTLMIYGLQRWLLRPPAAAQPARPATRLGEDAPDPGWTPAETRAWERVKEVADRVKPEELTSREAVTALAAGTIEAVAREINPGAKDPLWRFTVPEALALVEQVSGRLKLGIADGVPFGDRLTVGQALKLYEWRGAIDVAEQAYDVWRLLRMVNPLSAATQELREQATKRMYAWGRDEVGARIARKFVFEVGRGAIDLYGGRLRVTPEALAAHVSRKSRRDQANAAEAVVRSAAEPLRILIAGQVNAGKSSLVNALSAEAKAAVDVLPATPGATAYALQREGHPPTLLIDMKGLEGDATTLEALLGEAEDCDLVLWVANAARADRDVDARACAALRAAFAARHDRRAPPMMLVLTHVDRLRPFGEWAPPYDLVDASSPKAASIKAAVEAASGDLGFGASSIVPVCIEPGIGTYNVDAVWAGIAALLPEARRAQLVRSLSDVRGSLDWGRVWSQTLKAGRVLTDLARR